MGRTYRRAPSETVPLGALRRCLPWLYGIILVVAISGCAHYSINQPLRQADPDAGYRGRNLIDPENDDHLLLLLTFSGEEPGPPPFPTGSSKPSATRRFSSRAAKGGCWTKWTGSRVFPAGALPRPTMASFGTVSLKILRPVSLRRISRATSPVPPSSTPSTG